MTFTRFGIKILCLFILMSLVPLAIAGVIVYKHVYERTRYDVLRQVRSTAKNLNIQLSLLLSQRLIRVEDFSSDGFIRDCVEQMTLITPEYSSINDKLNAHLKNNKKSLDAKILDIEILDPRGVVIASTSQDQIGKDKSDRNYFKVPFLALERKGPFFSNDLERKGNTDELRLVYSSILKDKTLQGPIGVIVIKVNGDIIQEVFNQHVFDPDEESDLGHFSEIYIVNSKKTMIANSTSLKTMNFKQIINTTPVQEVFLSHGEWSGIYKNYKGVRVLGSVLFVSEMDWVILAEIDADKAFLPLTKIKYIFAISGGGVLLIVAIFSFLISNRINNTIRQFVTGLEMVADGNFERKIEVGRRRDEVQTLAKSFNLMTEKLKESKELEYKFDEVKMLHSLTEKINLGLTLEEVLNYVFESFRAIIPYDRIGVAFLFDNGKTVEHKWTRTDAETIKLGNGYSLKLEETTLSNIITTGKSRIITDLEEYLKVRPQSDSTKLMVEEGMLSSLTCPLIALGKPIGFIFFSSFKVNAYSNVHVELFMQIAGELAVTVEKSRLYQELVELNELKNGFLGMAAHDLRNPNVLIRLYLNQLVESLEGTNEIQRTWINKIQSISRSMMTLIDDFLDVSNVEAGQLKLDVNPVKLNVFITDNYEDNKSITEKKIYHT
ncbi:MAG: sensor histidine kinase/response regulator protein NtrY [Candidatus Scalindua brodae]|uniref:histidine kinase n=1 Tax=Candidatus Scalindua brodae TaxID=237368 RepID=A0A0B0EIY4_9BACT|nr:MAG: sensor histidine kinase/response regulator protein NtrY [Candidatus Scalindua brodae]